MPGIVNGGMPRSRLLILVVTSIVVHLLLDGCLRGAILLRSIVRSVRGRTSYEVLSHWLLVVAVVFLIVLARIARVPANALASTLVIQNPWLSILISLLVLLIAGSFLEALSLLIIDLAVSVSWHDGTLLAMVRILTRLLIDALPDGWIGRISIMALLEVMHLLVLSIGSAHHVLLSIPHSILHDDYIAVMTR